MQELPKTSELLEELIGRVSSIENFSDRVFSVYNMEELIGKIETQGFPIVAVGYELGNPAAGNQGTPSTGRGEPRGLVNVNKRFTIVVGTEYNWDGNDNGDDTKATATDLLDAVRGELLGFSGVNIKPWRFVGEGPTDSAVDGVIFYAQTWETTVAQKGKNA